MHPTSASASRPLPTASTIIQDTSTLPQPNHTLTTAWTTNTIVQLTTTSTTTSSITTPHTSTTTTRTQTLNSKPALTEPANRSDWVKSLLHQQKTGVPPLHQTLIDADDEMATALIAAGADVYACVLPVLSMKKDSSDGKHVLHTLVCNARWGFKGTTANASSTSLSTWNRSYPFEKTYDRLEVNHEHIVNVVLLLQARAPAGQLQYYGCNALTLGLLVGASKPVMTHLLQAAKAQDPALLSWRDHWGRTPLGIAAADGNTDMLALLLEFGADPAVTDGQKLTPIEHAIRNRHPKATRVLIENRCGAPASSEADAFAFDFDSFLKLKRIPAPNPVLEAMFAHADIDSLLIYQQQSDRHRDAVSRALIGRVEQAANSPVPRALDKLLDFAVPLLNAERLDQIAGVLLSSSGAERERENARQNVRANDADFLVERAQALREAANNGGI